MDPDKFFQPSTQVGPPPQSAQPGQVPGAQYGGPGQQPPLPQQNPPQPIQQSPKKSQKTMVIASIIVGVAVGLIIITALVVSNADKAANQTEQTQTPDSTTQAEILEPAQSVEVEQTSNSLSQDLSSLDDEKDLPADSLDDKTLGL
jgi:hypothetical protein